MTADARTRFDFDALRDLAGNKVFARGQAYHREGRVELLAVESGHVLAQVAGTQDYRIELTGFGDGGGDPAYKASVQLLRRMARLRNADDQAKHIEALKLRFVRKRNFMKLLG